MIETGEEQNSLEEGLPYAWNFAVHVVHDHFVDIIQFLTMGTTPEGYSTQQKKELVFCSSNFSVISGQLYKMETYEILRRYVLEFEHASILAKAHGGAVVGHYAGKVTMQKILRVGLWWPTLHKDSKSYCKACDACQRTGKLS